MGLSSSSFQQVALGGFILFLGFHAFNGGSQASISQEGDGVIVTTAVVNTILSGSAGGLGAMAIKRLGFSGHHWSLLTAINGGLTGMVSEAVHLRRPPPLPLTHLLMRVMGHQSSD